MTFRICAGTGDLVGTSPRRRAGIAAALTLGAMLLGACSDEVILEGERFDVRDPLAGVSDATAAAAAASGAATGEAPDSAIVRDVPISLPGQVNHTSWTHRNGSSTHRITHPALGSTLTQIWSADIGEGNSRRANITADPVSEGGRIYTLDARSRVTALSTGGGQIWSRDLTPGSDKNTDASGGGLALGNGKLFVTTGFGELLALKPTTGEVLWRQEFDAPVAGTPTVKGDLVYVTSRDNRAFAIKTETGRLHWQLPAAPTPSVTVGGSGPAVTDKLAIFPFGNAELIASLRLGGIRTWNATLAGQRRGKAYAGISDISAAPVIDGNVVYAGTPSGRIGAIDVNSGDRIWTASEGAISPIWPAGGSIFAVSDEAKLMRLDAKTGEVIWKVDLPYFRDEKPKRFSRIFVSFGPILAGGRLIVATDDEQLRSFDPRSGALLSSVPLPGGAASNPIVVNRTLYVVNGKGQLLAYR